MVVPKIAPPPAQEVMMTEIVGQPPQQYMTGPTRPAVSTPAIYASGPEYSSMYESRRGPGYPPDMGPVP